MARGTLQSFAGFQKATSENQSKGSMSETFSRDLLKRQGLRNAWVHINFATALPMNCWMRESVFNTSKFLSDIQTSPPPRNISSVSIQERRSKKSSRGYGRGNVWRASYFLALGCNKKIFFNLISNPWTGDHPPALFWGGQIILLLLTYYIFVETSPWAFTSIWYAHT